ncbi:MAG: hypothetical protein ACLTSL_11280 [Odoribacter splanchnicus]
MAFLLYTGLGFIAGIPLFEDYQTSIRFWGIHFHYEPMSRGALLLAMSFILSPSFFFFCGLSYGGFTEYG